MERAGVGRYRHYHRIVGYYALEAAVSCGAFFMAYALRRSLPGISSHELFGLKEYLWLLPIILGVWSSLLWVAGSYRKFRGRSLGEDLAQLVYVNILGTLGVFAFLAIVKAYHIHRSFIGAYAVMNLAGLLITRWAIRSVLLHWTREGYDRHYILIAGTDENAQKLAEYVEAMPGPLFQVRGFVSYDPQDVGRTIGRFDVMGTVQDIPSLAEREPIDEVYFDLSGRRLDDLEGVFVECERIGLTLRLVSPVFERLHSRLYGGSVGAAKCLTLSLTPPSGLQLFLKRVFDIVASAVLLLLLAPLFLVIACAIKLTSWGPVFFRQKRASLNGRPFTLYKFRTMVADAERRRWELEDRNIMNGPVFKVPDDPRVTWLGRFFRRTSLDELPQLWNVFRGDMSLVGPRPLPVYEVEKFERWQRRRMNMRPGLTCLWQVSGRNEIDFDGWMELDLRYIDRWSLFLDFKILAKTIPVVLSGRGAY